MRSGAGRSACGMSLASRPRVSSSSARSHSSSLSDLSHSSSSSLSESRCCRCWAVRTDCGAGGALSCDGGCGGACIGKAGTAGGEVGVGAVTVGVAGVGGSGEVSSVAVVLDVAAWWPPTGFLVTMAGAGWRHALVLLASDLNLDECVGGRSGPD